MRDGGKGRKKALFIGVSQITQNVKSRSIGNQGSRLYQARWWGFKRCFKQFKTNSQDGGNIIRKCDTRALKTIFMGKHITPPCAPFIPENWSSCFGKDKPKDEVSDP